MLELKQSLIVGVNTITGREIAWNENLFGNAVDSMSLVEIINLVEDLADKHGVTVNLDALISEDTLSVQDLYLCLSEAIES